MYLSQCFHPELIPDKGKILYLSNLVTLLISVTKKWPENSL